MLFNRATSGFYRLVWIIACLDAKPMARGIKSWRLRMAGVKHIGILLAIFLFASAPAFADNLEQARRINREAADLFSDGKLSEAADKYRQAIQLNPQSAGYHSNLALVLKDSNQLPAAEQEARLALKLNDKKPAYRYNLGVILQKAGKFAEAEGCFAEVVKTNALDADFRYRHAQVLFKLDRYAEAQEEMKLALLIKPNERDYHLLLGDAYYKLGKKEEALYEYQRVLDGVSEADVTPDLKTRIDYLKQVLNTR